MPRRTASLVPAPPVYDLRARYVTFFSAALGIFKSFYIYHVLLQRYRGIQTSSPWSSDRICCGNRSKSSGFPMNPPKPAARARAASCGSTFAVTATTNVFLSFG